MVGRINSNTAVIGSRVPVYYLQHDPVTMGMEEIYALYEIELYSINTFERRLDSGPCAVHGSRHGKTYRQLLLVNLLHVQKI